MAEPTAPPSYMEATTDEKQFPGQPGVAPYPAAAGYQGYPPAAGQAYPPGQGQPYPPAEGQAYPPAGGQAYPPAGGQAYPPAGGQAYPPAGGQAYPAAQAGYQASPAPVSTPRATHGDEEEGFSAGRGFNNKAIRAAFIKKVYFILFIQLLFTFGIVCIFYYVDAVRTFVQSHSWIYWCSYVLFIIMYFVLACCPTVRRKYPGNFVALIAFTFCLSYMTGTISSYYYTNGGNIVLIAMGICAGVTLGVTLFAIQTRFDFTSCGGFLFVFSFSLFLFGFIAIFTYSKILYTVYAWLAAVLFCMFLAYDTQLLIGGRRYELDPEEYIFGALNLYVDVVYLFLIILSLFGMSK